MKQLYVRIESDLPREVVSPYLFGANLGSGEGLVTGKARKEHRSPSRSTGVMVRRDVLEALRRLRPAFLHWPSGEAIDCYHGADEGSRCAEQTGNTKDDAVRHVFGTEAFLALCREVGAAPQLGVNVGSGALQSGIRWAGDVSKRWQEIGEGYPGARRRATYLTVGNPASHWLRHWTPERYAATYLDYAVYLREAAGRPVRLVAGGSHPQYPDWLERFLAAVGPHTDLVDTVAIRQSPSQGEAEVIREEDFRRLVALVFDIPKAVREAAAVCEAAWGPRPLGVMLDGWSTGCLAPDSESTGKNRVGARADTLLDAVLASLVWHTLMDCGPALTMASLSSVIGGGQPLIVTEGERYALTPTFFAWEMLGRHRGKARLTVECEAEGQARAQEGDPVSIAATLRGRELCVTLINTNFKHAVQAHFETTAHRIAEVQACTLGNAPARARNTPAAPREIEPQPLAVVQRPGGWSVLLPPHSLTLWVARLQRR